MRLAGYTSAVPLCMTFFKQVRKLVAVFGVNGHFKRMAVLPRFLGRPALTVPAAALRSIGGDFLLDGGCCLFHSGFHSGIRKVCIFRQTAHENGETVGRNYVTVVQTPAPDFKLRNLVLSGQIGVNFYMDLNSLTDEEKAASYMEFTVSSKTFTDPFDAEYMNLTHEYYGFTCYVNAVQMADTITAVFHYGDDETIEKTYSVLSYINKFEEQEDKFPEEVRNLVYSLADYGHYMQPFVAQSNGWVVGEQYSEMTKSYTESFDHDMIRDELADAGMALYRDYGESDVEKMTFALYPDAENAINVYIRLKDGYTGDVKINNGQYKAVKQDDGRYLVIIPNIAAHQLGRIYELNIETESGTATMRASAMTYVYELLNSAAYQDNETAKNITLQKASSPCGGDAFAVSGQVFS